MLLSIAMKMKLLLLLSFFLSWHVSATTIDRMSVAISGITDNSTTFDPNGRFDFQKKFFLMGIADSYLFDTGEWFDAGAGNANFFRTEPSSITTIGGLLGFSLEPPADGVVLRQSSFFDSGSHSSHIILGVSSPLIILAERGTSVAYFSGFVELLSNEDVFFPPDPRFNLVSAKVGDFVKLDVSYTLLRGEVWDEDIFSRTFDYRIAGQVDFTNSLPEPSSFWLLFIGIGLVYFRFRVPA